jgi:uncharacterized protein affecting Mg2+/Co2+ transport
MTYLFNYRKTLKNKMKEEKKTASEKNWRITSTRSSNK